MKRFIIIIIALFVCMFNYAETSDNIYISIYQPERDEITTEASEHLVTKMKQFVTLNGLASEDEDNRFVLTAKVLIISKDIVPSTPQKLSERIDFVFILGDIIENQVFETMTITSIGIGINENKAFINAINKINPNNEKIKFFLSNAKNKILSYYSEHCQQIIVEARQSVANKDYDNAIHQLMQIPIISDCSEDSQNLLLQYYSERTEYNAAQLLKQAKTIWSTSPTKEGASQVAEIIKQIPSNTSSQSEIIKLITIIEGELKADQQREWAFKMKQYKDNIEREKRELELRSEQQKANNAYRERQQIANNAARAQTIEACRQIGITYAQNQPKTVIYRRNVYYW